MADDNTFSHITVSADDEDDFVIQAGARAVRSPSVPQPAAAEPSVERSSSVREEPTEEPKSAGGSSEVEGSVSADKDVYRETTLEDLKGASMPTMQKTILVAALLLVVVFVAYYLFLR